MGVHGLWELLAPVGRRVSVETLAGKKLAIGTTTLALTLFLTLKPHEPLIFISRIMNCIPDASIWMVQFMKAMRDEKGEMIRNAHLLGFFRRICKLLFLRTKPVFVFDGATPALKRRTVIARRRQRDNAQAKVRKTAEKLLLNQLKAMKLKELAKEIENQKKRQKKQKNDAKGEKTLSEETNMVGNQLERDMVSKSFSQEKLDEMLAASIAAEDNGRFPNNASTSAAAAAIIPAEEDDSEVEERILPPEHGEIDPAVLASLPQSMQHDLLVQLKGKMIMPGETGMFGCSSNGGDAILRSGPSGNQEKLDEMLAASILAEEIERSPNCASKSADPFPFGENGEGYEDEDEDEEMMLPEMNGEFDPTVLAALPPSMQLDLLVQMRERLMAENRQKYQKVKKDPTKFSELQIQAYLKTVAFRREIDEVQKSAAGSGVGGVQTSRIASEANREFIFSSSFTGDKQAFRTARGETNGDKQLETPREHPSQNFINSVASASKSNAMSGSGLDESRRVFDDNIETYMDERGHNKHGSPFEGNENIDAEVIEGTLAEEIQILGQEYLSLGDEQRKLERNAESVSSEMFAECQELLQMFGLPYIIAPMEAEAQCAYMELANLVDGVVTDDSDVFLFGARSVYKNIFDDRKYVETYLMKDMEKELGLTREKLIRMALLLGSDYTEGVSGIGIVNAIEVVNAFPEKDGLHKFREWIESPDPTILKKFDAETGSTVKKRGPKVIDNGLKCSKRNLEEVSGSDLNILEGQEQQQSVTSMHDIKQIFMDKHRNVSKNWHIPPVFPSEAVVSAYFSPQVDNSTEPFTWGKPDHFVLRKLCWEKFGWGNQKADELLVPVLKEYDKHETQLRLEAFYTFNERFAKIRSKRIKKAVKGITGSQTLELMDNPLLEVSRSRKKRRANPVEPGDNKSEKPSSEIEGSDVGNQHYSMDKSLPKHSRKRRNSVEPIPAIPPMETEGRRSRNKGSHGNGRGGRRGRGRGDGVGRGRGKRSSGFEPRESSGNDTDDDEQEVLVENLEVPDKVRRSMRIRKPVNYTVNDSMMDDGEKSSDQSDEKCSAGEAVGRDLSSAQVVCEDAAAGHNENKQHNNAGDYAHEEHLHIDYHEMGGGFCTDKCEIDLPDVSQCGDPSFGAEFCKDYLNAGGGFCLDEGETKNDQDGTHCPTANASGSADPDPSHRIDFTNEADLDFGSVQSNLGPKGALDGLHATGKTDAYDTESNLDLQNASSNEGNSKEDASPPRNTTGKTSVGGLSAMPFLKRKRRKS
ncbi:DNA repair protein UVH3 isoform X5 [Juglans microcarpa x Juglans regia]|uniref:DNA repair protein UVH3 isoform X5 n=1 Tax=Juglans microcarpa x Juglans regia TaxID=2249226 RepID=UPI001B7F7204|nr:DNA repair protein UVH3 isoform X5 [Juglans microcarpa x Juglans regia]